MSPAERRRKPGEAARHGAFRILIPDAQFPGEADIEREVAGKSVVFCVHRERDPERIADADWRACDAVLAWHRMAIPAALAARLENCRIIVRTGVGVDRLDVAACGARGIPVCNVPDCGTAEVADHAIALMLALTRGIVTYQDRVKADPAGGWRWHPGPLVRRIRGGRFGIVGLGRIGTATVRRARAFGMEVAFYDPYVATGQEVALGVGRAETLDQLLPECDVVSLHTPLTDETRGMIDARAIARMKEGAVLINTSRGGVVDLDALYRGLKEGPLGGAGLDVLPNEPPDPVHPLLKAWRAEEAWLAGRLIVTPHAAFYSAAGFEDMRRKATETALAYLKDGRLKNCVNTEFLPKRGNLPRGTAPG
ncbi:MAG: C-terminal binding protein [Alphaproteobacteria bacterium]